MSVLVAFVMPDIKRKATLNHFKFCFITQNNYARESNRSENKLVLFD